MYIRRVLRFGFRVLVYGLFLGTLLPVPLGAQTLSWKRQLGTSSFDVSYDVATDSNGNIYISGYTSGSLGGFIQGRYDAWVAKYNSSGVLLWKQQLGTSNSDVSYDVATDSNGNVYIAGGKYGALGGSNQGLYDAWVAKYNSSGALLWKRQLGTSSFDYSRGVATDNNSNVYISGSTGGSLAGTNQGYFEPSYDAWVAKYNSSGALLWKRQLGTFDSDTSTAVATDSNGNVYISGNQGLYDALVAKYNSSGALLWKRQLATSEPEITASNGVATDSNGSVYISGYTSGSLAGAYQ